MEESRRCLEQKGGRIGVGSAGRAYRVGGVCLYVGTACPTAAPGGSWGVFGAKDARHGQTWCRFDSGVLHHSTAITIERRFVVLYRNGLSSESPA